MQKYLAAIEEANPDGLWKKLSGTPFGDWLSPEGKTDQVLVATAYWAYDVTLMQQMAHAISDSPDEQHYKELFEKIRDAFQKKFVHEDGFVAGADNSPSPFGQINNPEAKSKGGDTQTGYVLALHMNLLPDKLRAAAVQKLVKKIEDNHGLLATGFLGTPYLAGRVDQGRTDGAGVQAAAQHAISVVGIPGGARRDHHVGALERRPDEGRSEHEFLQPLCVRRGGGLDLSLCRGDRRVAARCGIPHRRAAPGVRCAAGIDCVRL